MTQRLLSSVDVLTAYVSGIREASQASSASLFVPAGPRGGRPVLVHDGNQDAVPELRSLEAALALAKRDDAPKLGGRPHFQPSVAEGCQLILLPHDFSDLSLGASAALHPLRRSSDSGYRLNKPGAWLGLRFADLDHALLARHGRGETRLSQTGLERLVLLAGVLAQYSRRVSDALDDPVTGLPARVQFELQLEDALRLAKRNHHPVSLILINPDRFADVNDRFGRHRGDEALGAIAQRLTSTLRSTDVIARYGGTTFALILSDTGPDSTEVVGMKILDALRGLTLLDGALELHFSIGAACVKPAVEETPAALLVHRADLALTAAKQSPEHRYEAWSHELESAALGQTDPLNGIFTGNMAKDYRNMALLSDTVKMVASTNSFQELVSWVTERLCVRLSADRVGLFARDGDSEPRPVHAVRLDPHGGRQPRPARQVQLRGEQISLIREAEQQARAMRVSDIDRKPGSENTSAFAIPLVARGHSLGCLYIDGQSDRLGLDAGDLIFLESLGAQLAIAFDRARLDEIERARKDEENKRLRAELEDLRKAMDGTELVYRSASMKALLVRAGRAALSEATVLVTGQSGTGKELMARLVHRLSKRNVKPPIIVDCASIPTTLIESELFGHERGAFTGAQQRKVGRVVEADHGTLILDEIGELPLEVQSKFLRFVQEKEVVSVGGTKTRKVDVRVIAVTNRNLKLESEAGRFREDLYHRLNVVHLHIPPLAVRSEDVTLLADHFLRKFSRQYHPASPRHLSNQATQAVEAYPWPGNVRELENRILQAVILSETAEIGPDELGVAKIDGAHSRNNSSDTETPVEPRLHSAEDRDGVEASATATQAADTGFPLPREKIWDALQELLASMVDSFLSSSANGNAQQPAPLGRWLSETIVLEAQEVEGHTMRRAAARIGIPEATFRRRLKKIRRTPDSGQPQRPAEWSQVRTLVGQLIRAEDEPHEDLLHCAKSLLLNDVAHHNNKSVAAAAALMGVTEPTFRRWTKELE